jgi:methylmalonyl-CoA/ethylmalonyl-CoA epimerase
MNEPTSFSPTCIRFHHMGIVVPNLKDACDWYVGVLGYKVSSKIFEDPIQRVKVCFLCETQNANSTIEIIQPSDSRSPAHKMLERGLCAYHLCYETCCLDKTLADLQARGCMIVGEPVSAVAFDMRRIAWIYTPFKQLIELVEARESRVTED